MNKLPSNRIYYAQNREDIILEAFFPDIKKGFYVDVGACHPDLASVTKRFYLKGWRGINIEPQTNLFGLFVEERKRDINLNIGVSNKESSLVLRSYINNQGRSTISPELQDAYMNSTVDNTSEFIDTKIKVSTLASIFKKHKVKSIQFLKIDVEGHEFEVLAGNNWLKYRPEVLCIEQTHIKTKQWHHLLKDQDYKQVFFDGLNEYYVDARTDRVKKFNYVDFILFQIDGGISSGDYDQITHYKEEANKQRAHNAALEYELKNIKGMIKRILKLAPSKLKRKTTTSLKSKT